MSTKIYNGYIIQTDDIRLIMKMLGEIGKRYDDVAKRVLAKVEARLVAGIWDYMAIDHEPNLLIKPEPGVSIYTKVSAIVMERREKVARTRQRDPAFDFEFEVTIFPIKNKTLAMLFCDNRELMPIFKHELIEPYPYWDNTDRPENVTAKEWRTREDDWDEAVGIQTPARAGLTRTYHTQYGPDVVLDDVLKAMEPFDVRAKRLAEDVLISQRSKELYPLPRTGQRGYDIMRDYAAIEAWVKEGTRLADKVAEILPKLTNPTREDLIKP